MARINLANIKSEIRGKVHETGLTDAQIERWVDIAQDRVCRGLDCDFLMDVKSIATVVSQRHYYIEAAFNKILHLLDETNDGVLTEVSERTLRDIDPDQSDTGTADMYAIMGQTEVNAPIGTAGTVTVTSSAATDISQTVRIRGLSGGVETTEALSLNGANIIPSTNSYDAGQEIQARLSAIATGKITVARSTTLVVIPANKLRRTFTKIALYRIPSAIVTLKALVYRNPVYLSEEEDIPDLPEMWESLVITGTLVEAHRYTYEFDIANNLDAIFEKDIKKLQEEQGVTRNSSRKIRIDAKYGSGLRYLRKPSTITGI